MIDLMTMRESLKIFSESEIRFICEECKMSLAELNDMDIEKVYDIVYEKMSNIEIEEIYFQAENEKDSERCRKASIIVAKLEHVMMQASFCFDEWKRV